MNTEKPETSYLARHNQLSSLSIHQTTLALAQSQSWFKYSTKFKIFVIGIDHCQQKFGGTLTTDIGAELLKTGTKIIEVREHSTSKRKEEEKLETSFSCRSIRITSLS